MDKNHKGEKNGFRMYAYYYGGMHQCANRNKAAGKVINEWNLLKRPITLYNGDIYYVKPLLGYWDDSSPTTIRQEIKIAKKFGVNGFIFNYYYNGFWRELYRPLDVFSEIGEKYNVEFAVSWCYRMPKRILPTPLNSKFKKQDHIILDVTEEEKHIVSKLSIPQFRSMISYCCNHYFYKKNYIRIDGKCYFSIYHITGLLHYYGVVGLNEVIKELRKVTKKYGFSLHLVGLLSITSENDEYKDQIGSLDLDAITAYCCLPDFQSSLAMQDYGELIKKRIKEWELVRENLNKSYYPTVAAGWNASPRGAPNYNPEKHGLQFPFVPIVINNSSKLFANYLSAAVKYAIRYLNPMERIVILGPWNEWTEGCYLLPDHKEKFGKLQAIFKIRSEFNV